MARVTYSNLSTEPRTNIVALISNTSNVSDPVTTTSEHRKWIYSREPDVKASDFGGYPFIIIPPAGFSAADTGGSVDGKSKNVFWDCEIEIVSSDRGYGDNNAKGLSQLGSISNNILTTLLNSTNRNTLAGYGMYFSTPVSTDPSSEILNNERVYRRSILCSFRSRIQVSS